MSGTAVNGVDYQKLSNKVAFAAGQKTATVDIKAIDDNIYEGDETVLLSIVPNDPNAGGTGAAFKIASNLSNTDILNKLLGVTTGLSNITLTATGNREAYGTFDNAPFDIGAGIVLQMAGNHSPSLTALNNDTGTIFFFSTSRILKRATIRSRLKIDFNTDTNGDSV